MPPEEELARLQVPRAIDAEQSVLGAMLIDARCVPDVMSKLRPDDFYMRTNREIFEVLFRMFNRFETIDVVTAVNAMKREGVYNEQTSLTYLRDLVENTPSTANVMDYVDIVLDKAVLRRISDTSAELAELARAEGSTAAEVLDVAEQRIYAIRQGRSAKGLTHISLVMANVYNTIRARQESGADFPGLSTGLIDLDRRITGLNNSDLIILAARPGVGKTSLALNIGTKVAKDSGKTVAVFSLEMSKEQLGTRLLSAEALMDNKKLLTGRIAGDEEWGRLALGVASLSSAKMYIDDDSSLTVADINAKCRRIENLGLVIIDYLQLMTSAGGPTRSQESRQQVVSDMTRALKLMAKELNVPVICMSQLSRANENRATGQRRPMLSDLRESGSIEQDADIVLFLYRESYYEEDTENPNVAECIVAKNRHGETGTVMLEWRPEFTLFRNLAISEEDL